MATIRELVTKWGFDIDTKPLQDMDDGIETLKTNIALVGTVAAASAASIFGLAKSTADAGDEIKKTSQAWNFGAEALQKYRFAAEKAGVEQEKFDAGMRSFIGRVGEAVNGSQAQADEFANLGVKLKDTEGRTRKTEAILADLADRFQEMPDQTRKTGIAMRLFGEDGARLTNMLNEGSEGLRRAGMEAESFGNILSEDTLAASEEFQNQLSDGIQILKGWKNTLGAALLPTVTKAIKAFKAWSLQNRAIIKQNMTKFIKGFAKFTTVLLKVLKQLIQSGVRVIRFFLKWQRVIKAVLIAFGIFKSLQLAGALGNIAIGAFQAAKAFIKMGQAAKLASVKAALIPIAIGAAIVLLALLAEDFITFMEGGDSIIGRVMKGFTKMWDDFLAGLEKSWKDFTKNIPGIAQIEKMLEGLDKIDRLSKGTLGKVAKHILPGGQLLDLSATDMLKASVAGLGGPLALGGIALNETSGAIQRGVSFVQQNTFQVSDEATAKIAAEEAARKNQEMLDRAGRKLQGDVNEQ